jgi:hypothetical protein
VVRGMMVGCSELLLPVNPATLAGGRPAEGG